MSDPHAQKRRASLVAVVLVSLVAGCGDEAAAQAPHAAAEPRSAVVAPAPPAATPGVPSTLEATLSRAGSPVRSVREAALRELEQAAPLARDAARRALSSSDAATRRGAAAALALIADDLCVPEIVAALRTADDSDAPALILALGRTTCRDAGTALVGSIEGPDELRAFRSAAAAAAFTGPIDLERLRAAAAPGHATHVRASALVALGGHAEPADHDLFLAASRDPLDPVRGAAARGLFASGGATEDDVRRLVVADGSERVRTAAATAARALGAVAVGPLSEALGRFRDDDTVPAAIASLAAIHEPAAFDALAEFVKDDTQDSGERGTAVRGLAAIDRDRAVSFLKRESAIFDTDLRVYCNEVLAIHASR